MANNNPILASDLIKDDGAIREIRQQLEDVRTEYTKLLNEIKKDAEKLNAVSKIMTGSTSDQTEAIFEQAEAADKLAKSYETYKIGLSKVGKQIAALKSSQSELNKVNKLEAEFNKAKVGSYEKLKAELGILQLQFKKMTKAEAENTTIGKAVAARIKEVNATLKEQDNLLKPVIKSKAKLTFQDKERIKIARLEEKLNQSVAGTYDALSAELSILKIRYKKLTEEEIKNTDAGQELVARIKEIDENLKAQDKSLGVTTRNVGNYREDIEAAIGEMGGFPGAAGGVVGGVKGMGNAFKALLANPVVLLIAAIVAGLGALFNAFTRSEKGAALMAKITGVVNAAMSQLVEVAVFLSDQLGNAFDDPLGSLQNFGKALAENIINRFKAIPLLAVAAGKAIKALWDRDLDALKEAGDDAFTAVAQAVSGLDEEQQSDLVEAVKETTVQLQKEAQAFIDLEVAKRAVRKSNRELVKSIEAVATAEGLANSFADDSTKSFKVREEQAEKAREALEKRSQLEVQLARNNLSLINRELALRRANGEEVEALLDQQVSNYQALAAAEREYTLAVRDNERTRDELKQDRLEKDLDILIDGFDNQRTINERIIANDRKTIDERRALLEETVRLSDKSFAKQVGIIQEFTGVAVDANDLIAESDAVALNQKIRGLGLSEIIEGRLLEIIRDRRLAIQELGEADQELSDTAVANAQAEIKADEDAKKKRIDDRLKEYDEQAALAESVLDLQKRTESQKTVDRLKAEAERLAKVIQINEEEEGALSETVVETYRNRIQGINAEIGKLAEGDKGGRDLFSLLGISINDEKKAALKSATDFIKNQLLEVFNLQKQLADQAVANADRRVSSAEAALQAEISAAQSGQAASVESAREALAEEKKLQKEALEEQQAQEKKQRQIQTAQQTVNLITAASKIFATLPIFAAIPAVALMFGTFAAAKLTAAKAAKKTFGQGGFEEFDYGGSHASGNDIYLGKTKSGADRYVEKKEAMQIYSAKAMAKNGSKIRAVSELLNKGSFDSVYVERELLATEGIADMGGVTVNTDMNQTNGILSGIRKDLRLREGRNHLGQRVVTRGNETTTYV